MTKPALVIFDSRQPLALLPALSGTAHGFCLSGDPVVAADCAEVFTHKCDEATLLASARLVNEQVDALRPALADWCHNLGEARIGSRSVRAWLRIGDTDASAWWFSLLAERNPFKSDLILRAAQLAVIRSLLASGEYGACHACCADHELNIAIRQVAAECGVFAHVRKRNLLDRARALPTFIMNSVAGQMLMALAVILRFFVQGCIARRKLPAMAERLPRTGDTLMVSYSPANAGDANTYKNRFYGPLQGLLTEKGRSLAWLCMHVNLGGKRFSQSMDEAASQLANGTRITLLQEHLSPLTLLSVLGRWFLLACKGIRLSGQVCDAAATAPFSPACRAYLRRDWIASTAGKTGAEGILFHAAYNALFGSIPAPEHTIYCLEMHAWEKALCSAAQDNGVSGVIGFQHAAFSHNYFHFYHAEESVHAARLPLQLPLPDIIAASGSHSATEFRSCGYPRVEEVESIRTLYVNGLFSKTEGLGAGEANAILLAGSIDRKENTTMLGIALEAARAYGTMKLLLKGHPLCPFKDILSRFTGGAPMPETEECTGTLPDALQRAVFVFVPTSTASIEALAFGCKVVLPLVPDGILMNPVIDFPEKYTTASSGQELLAGMQTRMTPEQRQDAARASEAFIRAYWNLESTLPKWGALLNV
ncbi:hypothetical protein N1030_14155 [Desulfovibrio mangrovi]|uniref:hypothetical protein n=1 Tax=Desulfovibrio mangrovi TaxID=2976983 RepID=UPI0022485363|nr:hypothetical protein [Desulfovibrio mangrovi]UZP66743.1 hypothetical protein N1030_14155 [Desulfovibrio mangrovi]